MNPIFKAFLICEEIRVDDRDSYSLLKTYNRIYADRFPLVNPRMVIYLLWYGGQGKHRIKISLLNPERDNTLIEREAVTDLDPVTEQIHCVCYPFITFPYPGNYWWKITMDDDEIGYFPLHIEPKSYLNR
ncbi:MAG: hypothetical protein M1269_05425 [Chloroflexi bacterium]|nr:hypothetical protein [Chloroflexota bacterium]